MGDEDSSLASKCMAFCQALASQGQHFNFSISIGSDFSFSLDTRSKAVTSQGTKKMASPSTLLRNARRREEFLAKKQQESSTRISSENSAAVKELKCDQCEYVAASEKGLRQHIRMKHKEVLRCSDESRGPLDCSSPLLSNTREELCQNCEAPFTTGHQCEDSVESKQKPDEEEAVKCYLCQETFNSEGDLENHYNAKHPNQCRYCRVLKPNQCSFFCPNYVQH